MKREFKNISLKDYNSFGVDVCADRLIEFDTVESLREIFSDTTVADHSWYVLSGGNNILFTSDCHITLIHPTMRDIRVTYEKESVVGVYVGAGVEWDDLVQWSVARNLWGVENLSLIPGYAGAAPVQNIGAYGSEVKDVIESVELLDIRTMSERVYALEECRFGYRDSIFKNELKGSVVITGINILLNRDAKPKLGYGDLAAEVDSLGGVSLQNIRHAVVNIRSSKLPDIKVMGNAGSFFKNPVVPTSTGVALKEQYPDMPLYGCLCEGLSKLAAGWLIDRSGLKGYRLGNVGVHSTQALVLVNFGGATGADIVALSDYVRQVVNDKFGIDLEPEVNFL